MNKVKFFVVATPDRKVSGRKEEMRKFKKVLLTAAALFAAITITGGVKASAADYNIGVNQEVKGSFTGNDSNTYNFKAPGKGYFHIEVYFEGGVHENGRTVTGTNVTFKTQMKSEYKNYWNDNWIGLSEQKAVSPNYCFRAGQPISLTLSSSWSDVTFSYKLKIVYTKDKYFEKENNGSASKATSIKKKKTYSGIITDGDDVDWFVFKAPKAGKYRFMAVNTEEKHCWTAFTPYISKYKKGISNAYVAAYSGDGWKNIITVRLKKGQKYYIKVAKGYTDNASYKIKVK